VNGRVAAWRLFDEYVDYCIKKGFRKPSSKNEFNKMLKINYETEKKNLIDDVDGTYKKWVWVFGIKKNVFPILPVFPDVSLRATIEKSCDILGKTGKTGKNDVSSFDEKLPVDTILESAKMGKKLQESTPNCVTQNTVTDFPQQQVVGLIRAKMLELARTFPDGIPGHVLFKSLEVSGADMEKVREAIEHLSIFGSLIFQTIKGSQCYLWAGV
jgi:hypothetical protein